MILTCLKLIIESIRILLEHYLDLSRGRIDND